MSPILNLHISKDNRGFLGGWLWRPEGKRQLGWTRVRSTQQGCARGLTCELPTFCTCYSSRIHGKHGEEVLPCRAVTEGSPHAF